MTLRSIVRIAAVFAAVLTLATVSHRASAQLAPAETHNDGPFGVDVQTLYKGPADKGEGIDWTMIDMKWVAMETGSQGNYDFSATDKEVAYYANYGFHQIYVFQIATANPLYPSDVAHADVVIGAIARWAGAVAAHYKGRGLIYEIGNEPEVFPMGGFWSDPGTYTKMARAAAKAIKNADPDAKVMVCAVAWMDKPFLTTCFQDGLLSDNTVDYVSFHGYHRVNIMPESGLGRDVDWLRDQVAQSAPGQHIQVVDSERSYGIIPFGQPKNVNNWKNLVYTEDEQAAYLARHYLAEIKLGIPIIIWYKDMHGEDGKSLWYGEDGPRGLRPSGYVYKNLSLLLPNSPSSEANELAQVTFNGKRDSSNVICFSYLRPLANGKHQIVIALWNPIEAFDGKILDSRTLQAGKMVETWRPIQSSDPVNVPVFVRIKYPRDATAETFDLLAKTPDQQTAPIALHRDKDMLVTDAVSAGPMPTVIVVNVD